MFRFKGEEIISMQACGSRIGRREGGQNIWRENNGRKAVTHSLQPAKHLCSIGNKDIIYDFESHTQDLTYSEPALKISK